MRLPLLYTCHIPRPSHAPWCDHSNNILPEIYTKLRNCSKIGVGNSWSKLQDAKIGLQGSSSLVSTPLSYRGGGEVTLSLPTLWRYIGEADKKLHAFLTSAVIKMVSLTARPLYPQGKRPVRTQQAVETPEPFWTFMLRRKSLLAPVGNRSPDPPALALVTVQTTPHRVQYQ